MAVVTDPFDPEKRTAVSLLPDERWWYDHADYASVDCYTRIQPCRPDADGGDDQCSICRSLGGGECVSASDADVGSGICVPRNATVDYAVNRSEINPWTTTVAAALVTLADGSVVVTKSTDCIDPSLVRKDPVHESEYPEEVGLMNCDYVVACGGEGVGYPVHPTAERLVASADDIDFDVRTLASRDASCLCEPGYVQVRDSGSGRPSCAESEEGGILARIPDLGCPVTFDTGLTTGCLCDPATQLRLAEVVSEKPERVETDYGVEFLDAAKGLMEALVQSGRPVRDACVPRPGVDDRVAALGYAYAPHLFGRSRELTAFNGGHLMTGGLVRRGAVTRDGEWWSRIDSSSGAGDDGRDRAALLSESLGGVTPYVGTGSIAAHEWGGHHLNDNNLTGPGGGPDFTAHPNAVLRVVPPPASGIPGRGEDSMDHAVGLVASQGRVYPLGVHGRVNYDSRRASGSADPRGAADGSDSTYLGPKDADPDNLAHESPLGRARATHDSGICATAFVVPAARQPPPGDSEDPMLPLVHERPFARAAGFTPLVRVFRTACALLLDEGAAGLPSLFPGLHGDDTGMGPEEARRRLDVLGSDGLGALLVQPVTIGESGGAKSSLFARFGEEMLAANSPRLVDHYLVGPGSRRSWGEDEARELFALPPTADRIVSNETSFFSGLGLPSGSSGAGVDRGDDFFASAVLSADSTVLNGFTPVARPQTLPVSTPPEWLWHEPRGPARTDAAASSAGVLAGLRNRYADTTSRRFTGHLTTGHDDYYNERNTYNPPKPAFWREDKHVEKELRSVVRPLATIGIPMLAPIDLALTYDTHAHTSTGTAHAVVPLKFHAYDALWQQSVVDSGEFPRIVPPSMAMLESSYRLRTLASEAFFRADAVSPRQRSDWALGTHTAGHYLAGLFSPPSLAEETGQANCYPCTGALPQYVTLLVPRTRGPGSHATADDEDIARAVESEGALDALAALAAREKCNCTTDVFCMTTNHHQNEFGNTVAAVPSRGNRHTPFLLSSSLPKNDPEHAAAVLMAQAGDVGVLGEVGRTGRVKAPLVETARRGWHEDTVFPLAANRWRALRTNVAWTPGSARPVVRAREQLVDGESAVLDLDRTNTKGMGGGRLDLPGPEELDRDDAGYVSEPARSEARDFVARARVPGSTGRRQLDFFESSCGTVPSTFGTGTFNPWAEGAGDVVVLYGTPLFSRPDATSALYDGALALDGSDGEPPAKKRPVRPRNRIMRKVHVMAVNAPTMNGFASGQTAAEAALTRGRELWYAPYVKPALDPAATTSMEGIRSKAAEPFDGLALRDFATLDSPTLAKFCHHHHYGLDGLISFENRHPFSCPSDRRPFPPTREGKIQPCALAEMGAVPRSDTAAVVVMETPRL